MINIYIRLQINQFHHIFLMKKRSFYVKIDDISLKTALLKNIYCTKQKLSKIKERILKTSNFLIFYLLGAIKDFLCKKEGREIQIK